MDYLTLGLIAVAALLLIIALIMFYGAKTTSDTSTRTRNGYVPRLFGVALSDVPDQLYNPNKINSGIGLVWGALVLAVLAGISSAIKKAPLAATALRNVSQRFLPTTSGITLQ